MERLKQEKSRRGFSSEDFLNVLMKLSKTISEPDKYLVNTSEIIVNFGGKAGTPTIVVSTGYSSNYYCIVPIMVNLMGFEEFTCRI